MSQIYHLDNLNMWLTFLDITVCVVVKCDMECLVHFEAPFLQFNA